LKFSNRLFVFACTSVKAGICKKENFYAGQYFSIGQERQQDNRTWSLYLERLNKQKIEIINILKCQ